MELKKAIMLKWNNEANIPKTKFYHIIGNEKLGFRLEKSDGILSDCQKYGFIENISPDQTQVINLS